MAGVICVNLAVEDLLSEFLLRAVLDQSRRSYLVGAVYGRKGVGFLKKNLRAFNNASKGCAHIVIVDLDSELCSPRLIEVMFECSIADYRNRCHRNLVFKVAEREIESWIMADRTAFAQFLGVNIDRIPSNTDSIPQPKEFLIDLARRSRFRVIRDDVTPKSRDIRRIGPNYNGRLAKFLTESWNATRARSHSPSLARLTDALNSFHPLFS